MVKQKCKALVVLLEVLPRDRNMESVTCNSYIPSFLGKEGERGQKLYFPIFLDVYDINSSFVPAREEESLPVTNTNFSIVCMWISHCILE